MAPRISPQPVSGLILVLLGGGLTGAQGAELAGPADKSMVTGNVIQDQIEQDVRAFLLEATCRF